MLDGSRPLLDAVKDMFSTPGRQIEGFSLDDVTTLFSDLESLIVDKIKEATEEAAKANAVQEEEEAVAEEEPAHEEVVPEPLKRVAPTKVEKPEARPVVAPVKETPAPRKAPAKEEPKESPAQQILAERQALKVQRVAVVEEEQQDEEEAAEEEVEQGTEEEVSAEQQPSETSDILQRPRFTSAGSKVLGTTRTLSLHTPTPFFKKKKQLTKIFSSPTAHLAKHRPRNHRNRRRPSRRPLAKDGNGSRVKFNHPALKEEPSLPTLDAEPEGETAGEEEKEVEVKRERPPSMMMMGGRGRGMGFGGFDPSAVKLKPSAARGDGGGGAGRGGVAVMPGGFDPSAVKLKPSGGSAVLPRSSPAGGRGGGGPPPGQGRGFALPGMAGRGEGGKPSPSASVLRKSEDTSAIQNFPRSAHDLPRSQSAILPRQKAIAGAEAARPSSAPGSPKPGGESPKLTGADAMLQWCVNNAARRDIPVTNFTTSFKGNDVVMSPLS